MTEKPIRTGREFIVLPRKEFVLPKPPMRKVRRSVVREVNVLDSTFDDNTEAIEVGGYHFIRPEQEKYRHYRAYPNELEHDGLKGYLSENNDVWAIKTAHGIFVGRPGPGFRKAAAEAGFNCKRSPFDTYTRGYDYVGVSDFVPHSNWNDSPWLFERIDMHTGRLKPEFSHLFSQRYKKERRETEEEVEEEIPPERPAAKPEPIKLLVSEIKDDHDAFRFLLARIDPEIDHAFAATEMHRPNPAVISYVVKKLGISRASKPQDVRKDVKNLLRRFHHDRFQPSGGGFSDAHHRRVINLLTSMFNFLKNVKA